MSGHQSDVARYNRRIEALRQIPCIVDHRREQNMPCSPAFHPRKFVHPECVIAAQDLASAMAAAAARDAEAQARWAREAAPVVGPVRRRWRLWRG